MKKIFFIVVLLSLYTTLRAQNSAVDRGLRVLTPEFVQAQLEFLASDWTEGREAGKKGGYMAGDYIRSLFKMNGLTPYGDPETVTPNRYQKLLGLSERTDTSFFQPFLITEISPSADHQLWIKENQSGVTTYYNCQTDFIAPLRETGASFHAPVVFVGYGFQDTKSGYNDFAGLNVKNKIIIRLTGLPGDGDSVSTAGQQFRKIDREKLNENKNETAQKAGALAVLELNPKLLLKKTVANVPFRYNEAMYEGDNRPESFYDRRFVLQGQQNRQIPVISISQKLFDDLTGLSDSLTEQLTVKASAFHKISFDIKNKETGVSLTAHTRTLQLRNILAIIEGEKKEEFVVVGGHYDHVGKYNGYIWNGADDNGSGAVAVTSLAKAFIATGVKPKRSIILACWDGEERGELGSEYFVAHFKHPERIKVYQNFDMIGRNSGPSAPQNQVALLYTQSAGYLADLTRREIKGHSIDLDVNYSPMEDPRGGSDNTSFAKRNIPMLWFHTGGHTDYHQASDQSELINWAKMTNIIKTSFLDVWQLANE